MNPFITKVIAFSISAFLFQTIGSIGGQPYENGDSHHKSRKDRLKEKAREKAGRAMDAARDFPKNARHKAASAMGSIASVPAGAYGGVRGAVDEMKNQRNYHKKLPKHLRSKEKFDIRERAGAVKDSTLEYAERYAGKAKKRVEKNLGYHRN